MIKEVRFAPDSALEGDGFEPLVPRRKTLLRPICRIPWQRLRRWAAAKSRFAAGERRAPG